MSLDVRNRLASLVWAREDVFTVYVRERDLGKAPFDAMGWSIGEVLPERDGNAIALYLTEDGVTHVLHAVLSRTEARYQALRDRAAVCEAPWAT